jgi:hypothetical protein
MPLDELYGHLKVTQVAVVFLAYRLGEGENLKEELKNYTRTAWENGLIRGGAKSDEDVATPVDLPNLFRGMKIACDHIAELIEGQTGMSIENPTQVSEDVFRSGILHALASGVDRHVLRVVAEAASLSGVRKFSESPLSIAKRTGGYHHGSITPEKVVSAFQRMSEKGVFSEIRINEDLVSGRVADFEQLLEIGMNPPNPPRLTETSSSR